jgi:hypothetical protein
MSADTLLLRLDGVKRIGPRRWLAKCPGHEDRSPSLSVREMEDGRILIHDFGGCQVEEVLDAVGLTFDSLFPERPIDHAKRERRPFFPQDVFEIVRFEISIAAIIAADMHKQKAVSEADYQRLFTAAERLNDIGVAAYGR